MPEPQTYNFDGIAEAQAGPKIGPETAFHGPSWNPIMVPKGPSAEGHRVDNAVGGLPPELAALSALSLGRAVLRPGASLAGRAVAGAKNVAAQVAPPLMYEGTKSLLEGMGISSPLAVAAAMAISGWGAKGRGIATAEGEAATAAKAPRTTSPVAAPPVAPAPPMPPPAAQAATAAVSKDEQVMQALMDQAGFSQSEATKAVKWMKDGAPSELVWKRIQAARPLSQSGAFAKLPSDAEVAASVADRNATGRWPQDK